MLAPPNLASILDALPEGSFLRNYVRWGAAQTDAPIIFHVGSILSVLSVLTPMDYAARPGRGLAVHTPVWGILVGPSGVARKSTVIRLVMRLLREVAPEKQGQQPDSPEGLVASMSSDPQQIIIYPEYGEFMAKAGPGSRQEGIKTLQVALSDCEPYHRKLVRQQVSIDMPRLSLLGGISNPYLESYTTIEDWTGGFMSRMSVWVGRSEHDPEMFAHIDTDALGEDLIHQMCCAHSRMVIPPEGLDDEGLATFKLWTKGMDTRAKANATSENMRGILVRAQELVLKFAMINAWIEGRAKDIPWMLGGHDIHVGIVLAEASIRSVECILETLSSTDYQRNRRRLLALLADGPQAKTSLARTLKVSKRVFDGLIASVIQENVVVELPANAHNVHFYTLQDTAAQEEIEDINAVAMELAPADGEGATVVPINKAELEAQAEARAVDHADIHQEDYFDEVDDEFDDRWDVRGGY